MRPRTKLRAAFLPMVLVLTAITPASGAAPDPATQLLRKAAEVRSAFATGSLTDALTATAGLAGIGPQAAASSVIEDLAVPAGLAEPIGRLSGAIREATEIARSAVRRSVGRTEAVATALSGDLARGLPRSYAGVVDMARMQRAAVTVTRALDQEIPRLQELARHVPAAPSVDGCDLLDQSPWICVGGTGANTITSDYALVIDLGGDDRHLHAAGGADLLGNTMPVSVTIDLSGSDRYEATVRENIGSVAVLGSAFLGVGILVDAAGDDTYIAQSSDAQFYGAASSLLGIGMLADLGGDDGYRVSTTRPVGAGVSGLGTAFAGISTFHDREGDDAYLVGSRPVLGYDVYGRLTGGVAVAQGMGLHTSAGGHVGPATVGIASAAAVFADDAGNDSMTIEAVSATVPPEAWGASSGSALVAGGGLGSQPHASMALTGPGEASWSLRAETGSNLAPARVVGLGHGMSGGFGLLSDTGGDDDYTATATARSTRSLAIADGCGCAGATAESGQASTLTHGTGEGSIGVMDDAGGDDLYVASARSIASIVVQDERSEGAEEPAEGSALSGSAVVVAQGAAEAVGTGLLRDHDGDDRYETSADSEARAEASSRDPGRPADAFATTGTATTVAQGAARDDARGVFEDLGGTDSYEARAGTSATADPPTAIGHGAVRTLAQAAVDGASHATFTDADGGLMDVFVSHPSRPACEGSRGTGIWRDCGSELGIGVNG